MALRFRQPRVAGIVRSRTHSLEESFALAYSLEVQFASRLRSLRRRHSGNGSAVPLLGARTDHHHSGGALTTPWESAEMPVFGSGEAPMAALP